jgi:hypothetical protein
MSGALHFHSCRWKAVGRIVPWNRVEWPLPDFYRYEPHTRRFLRVRYDERDLGTVVSETQMPDSAGLPEAVLYGAEAAEIHLVQVMGGVPLWIGYHDPVIPPIWRAPLLW